MLFSSARMSGLNIVVLKVYFMTPLMIEVHISIWSFQLSCEELWIVCLGRYEERSDYIGSKKWLTLCHCVIAPKRERGWLDLKHFQGHSWKIILKYRNCCSWKFGYISALVSLMFAENWEKNKVSTSFAFICNKELFALKCEIANWKELKITWQLHGAPPWAQLLLQALWKS